MWGIFSDLPPRGKPNKNSEGHGFKIIIVVYDILLMFIFSKHKIGGIFWWLFIKLLPFKA